ncbi:TPA: hypothetical protein ACNBJ0_005047 [Escherichia coli]|nr:hypothetical protein [Escherichia coli]
MQGGYGKFGLRIQR